MNADEPTIKPMPDAKAEAQPKVETKPADPKRTEPKPETKVSEAKAGEVRPEVKPVATKTALANKIVFALAITGILACLVAAYVLGRERMAQPPVFKPVSNPYESAIYANGIVESDQPNGENINIFPEVSGPVTRIYAQEGQMVKAGALLLTIDDAVQRATTEQLRLQSEAALALLNELKAAPRPETLAIAAAQVTLAETGLKVASDQYDKDLAAHDLAPKAISQDVLDTAKDTVSQAAAALGVANRQFELTKAGTWSYDLANQQKIYAALTQGYQAAKVLLGKYSIKAPVAGVVLAVRTTIGGYVSSLGSYDTYTEAAGPLMVMGGPPDHLEVRCYVDEILVSRLPAAWHMQAQMSIPGTDTKIPLEFVRVQPYVSPKIELSNERQEQVDLRVLPVIFRFEKKDAPIYPGQLVDVFIGQQ